MVTPAYALHQLLVATFGTPDMRSFIVMGCHGEACGHDLPSAEVSENRMAAAIVECLLSRGLVDGPFFEDLLRACPSRRREILEVQARFQEAGARRSIRWGAEPDVFERVERNPESPRSFHRLTPGDVVPGPGIDRFRLVECLGEGLMGTTWMACALPFAEPGRVAPSLVSPSAAVTVLPEAFADGGSSVGQREEVFKRLQRASEVGHPNLIRVLLARGSHLGNPYYVTEFLAQRDLRKAVLAGVLAPRQAFRMVIQVAEGLKCAHARQLFHGAITPRDILLGEDGRPRLSNFSLLFAMGGQPWAAGVYLAPELWTSRREPDTAMDQYGLAMTALFCLHGADLPARAVRDPASFMKEMDLSPDLVAVLARALEWDADHRFEGVAQMCDHLAGAVQGEGGPRTPGRPLGPGDLRGRDAELAQVDQALDQLSKRCSQVILVEGAQGLGKTSLLAEVARRAASRGYQVVRAAAEASESRRSYGLWARICEGLLGVATDPDARRAGVNAGADRLGLAGDARNTLHRLLRTTCGARAPAPSGISPCLVSETTRLLPVPRVLSTLLREATDRSQVVLLVDDIQWADGPSLRFIQALAEAASDPGPSRVRGLLLVLGCGSGSVGEVADIRGASSTLPLRLGLLPEDCVEWLARRTWARQAGGEPDEVRLATALASIRHLGQGNPLATVVLSHLLWAEPATEGIPSALEGQVDRLLSRLSLPDVRLLGLCSALGPLFDEAQVARVVEVAGSWGIPTPSLDRLCAAGVLTRIPGGPAGEGTSEAEKGEKVAFAHPLFRDRVLALLEQDGTRRVQEASLRILAAEPRQPERTAALLRVLGRGPEAAEDLAVSAEDALELGAYAHAVELLRECQALVAGAAPAPALASRMARWRYLEGLALLNLGALEEAENVFSLALRLLGMAERTRSAPGTVGRAQVFWDLALQATRVRIKSLQRGRGDPPEGRDHALATQILEKLAEVQFFTAQERLPASALMAADLLEHVRPDQRIGQPYASIGYLVSLFPRQVHPLARPPRHWFRLARETARRGGDPADRVMVQVLEATVLQNQGRWADADRILAEARHLAATCAVGYGEDFTRTLVALSLFFRGNLRDAWVIFQALEGDARAYGRAMQEIWALSGQAECLLQLGNTGEAEKILQRAIVRLQQAPDRPSILICHGLRALALNRMGRCAEADGEVATTLAQVDACMFPPGWVALEAYSGLTEVLFDRWVAGSGGGDDKARALGALGQLRLLARLNPIARARHLLFEALAARILGHPRRCADLLARALQRAVRLELKYDQALLWLAVADQDSDALADRLGQDGRAGREGARAMALRLFQDMGVVGPPTFVARRPAR